MTTIIKEIEFKVNGEYYYIDVEISADVNVYSNGIGDYEYWGSRGVDLGDMEFEISNINFNKNEFTQFQILIIQKYLKENESEIEQLFIDEWYDEKDY